jgi:CRISPR/Cas system-associated endonuclease Cas1
MSEPFKKDFAGQILSRLETETKYHDNRKSFEDIILFQAEKLKNAILNQSTYEAFLYDRR